MSKTLIIRWCIIMAVATYSILKIIPTYQFYTNKNSQLDRQLITNKIEKIIVEGNNNDISNIAILSDIETEFGVTMTDLDDARDISLTNVTMVESLVSYVNIPILADQILHFYDNLQDESLKLGLDLKGGALLVYEIKAEDYFFSKVDQENIIELKSKIQNKTFDFNSIDSFFETHNHIVLKKYFIEFIADQELDATDNRSIIDALKLDAQQARNSNIGTIYKRISKGSVGLDDYQVVAQGEYRIQIKVPGLSSDGLSNLVNLINQSAVFEMSLIDENPKNLKSLILEIDQMHGSDLSNLLIARERYFIAREHISLFNTILQSDESRKILSKHYNNIALGKEFLDETVSVVEIYLLKYEYDHISGIFSPPVGSGDIIQAQDGIGPQGTPEYNKPIVTLKLSDQASLSFGAFTGKHKGDRLAIVLDGIVYMAPGINNRIDGGEVLITGCENQAEAINIAAILEAGSFSAKMGVVQNHFIGPTLGQESIEKGSQSMKISIVIVLIFMLIYYFIRNVGSRIAGLIACIALIFNLILICAILADLGATLTFPGIAGLLLIVGMSVDANVIIFERIKEEIQEIKARNSLTHAINIGYNKAFIAILDANITTIIVAILLFTIGKDDIQGFGTTLTIGILCSMFTGVFVTKTFFLTYAQLFKKNMKAG